MTNRPEIDLKPVSSGFDVRTFWTQASVRATTSCAASQDEAWVVVEWMQPVGCERYGSDNTIWAGRILWDQPNRLTVVQ